MASISLAAVLIVYILKGYKIEFNAGVFIFTGLADVLLAQVILGRV